jgi:hypothetical protein
LPDYVERVSADGKPSGAETTLVPIVPVDQGDEVPAAAMIAVTATPPAALLAEVIWGLASHTGSLRQADGDPGSLYWFALNLGDAILCAVIAFALTRRYAFTRAGRIGWAAAVLLLGPAVLLTLLAIYTWPARERCPACGRKRVVTHESCDHCKAGFAPPAADGTEILVA